MFRCIFLGCNFLLCLSLRSCTGMSCCSLKNGRGLAITTTFNNDSGARRQTLGFFPLPSVEQGSASCTAFHDHYDSEERPRRIWIFSREAGWALFFYVTFKRGLTGWNLPRYETLRSRKIFSLARRWSDALLQKLSGIPRSVTQPQAVERARTVLGFKTLKPVQAARCPQSHPHLTTAASSQLARQGC